MNRESQHETVFKLYRTLITCASLAPYAVDEQALYQSVCDTLVRSELFQLAYFAYTSENAPRVAEPIARSGDTQGFLEELKIALSKDEYEDPATVCLRTGDACWIKNLAAHRGMDPMRPAFLRCGYTSVISVPVLSKDTPHGALTLYYDRPDAYPQSLVDLLKEQLSHVQWVFAGRSPTPRPHSEELDTELRKLIDALPITLGLNDANGLLLHINRRVVETTGYTLEDHVFRDAVVKYVHPDDLDRMYSVASQGYMHGAPFEFEVRQLWKDKQFHWVLVNFAPIRDADGRIIRWCSAGTDIQQLKQAEEKLRKSEADLLEAQRISHTGSWRHDIASGAVTFSPEIYRIFGVSPGASDTDFWLKRIHSEDERRIRELVETSELQKLGFEADYRIVLEDGALKHLHAIGHPVLTAQGDLAEFVGTVMDVTAAKQAEEKIRQSEKEARQLLIENASLISDLQREGQNFRLIVDTVPGFLCTMTAQGQIEFVNQGILDYTGWDVEQLADWRPLLHPDERELVFTRWMRSVETGDPYNIEHRILGADGVYRWFMVRGLPLRDAQGRIVRWYVLVTDIDELRKTHEKLQRSEAFLAQGQKISHTGSFGRNVLSEKLYWSEETYRIYELDRSVEPTLGWLIHRIHPEDRARVQQTIESAVDHRTGFDIEYRLLRRDDSVKHLHVVIQTQENASGELEFVGAVTDITAAKKAEEKIRQSEKEARQLLDLSPLHISELGPNGERLYTNRASLDYFGITLEEWQNADLRRVLHPQDAEPAARELPGNFKSGSPFEYEARLPRKDGQYRWFHYRFSPMSDEEGRTTRWYAAGTDINDRKLAEQRLQEENVSLREEIDKASMFEEIVGASAPLKSVLSRISKVAPTDSSVLITGETGTGKELVARAIHRRSERSSHPFVSVNCAVIPRDLIASELFGHEKGAFTGATQRRLGRFELAERGTLFLDEVGELPPETQIALLRVLQEREFERIGGTGKIRADVRVIAATNRDLEAALEAGTFRSDLYYRLNVFPIELPPLRKRSEDIPLLVAYFLNRYARKAGRHFTAVDKKSLDLLQSYGWPGNIRELQNVIERSVIVSESQTFSVDESWLSRKPSAPDASPQPYLLNPTPAQEKAAIEAALRECGGRVYGPSGAATKLGIPRSTLETKIKTLKIDKHRFKGTGPSKDS